MKMVKELFERVRNGRISERRILKRLPKSFSVACWVRLKENPQLENSEGEILTSVFDINSKGVCIRWPRDWQCQLCPYHVDLTKGTVCELEECVLKIKTVDVGTLMKLSIQVGNKVYENIKAEVVWHRESPESSDRFDKLGLVFKDLVRFDSL
ncbi:MAG: hypothetical protein ABH857_00605 [Elusimicrobiota bacterium]